MNDQSTNLQDFFTMFNIDVKTLNQDEQQRIALGFLHHYLTRTLEDFPEIEAKMDAYFKEYQQILKNS